MPSLEVLPNLFHLLDLQAHIDECPYCMYVLGGHVVREM